MIAAAGLKILVSAEPGRGLLVYPFKYLPLLRVLAEEAGIGQQKSSRSRSDSK
jgi:hypothetical protein